MFLFSAHRTHRLSTSLRFRELLNKVKHRAGRSQSQVEKYSTLSFLQQPSFVSEKTLLPKSPAMYASLTEREAGPCLPRTAGSQPQHPKPAQEPLPGAFPAPELGRSSWITAIQGWHSSTSVITQTTTNQSTLPWSWKAKP